MTDKERIQAIEILHRYTKSVLYKSTDASSIRVVCETATKEGADLGGADLEGADLEGACLGGAYLRGAYLRGADLGGTDLSGADLSGADLIGAYLTGTDLIGTNLTGTNLGGASLRGADLSGADFRGARLRGADLSGADLRKAKGVSKYLTTPMYILYDQPGSIRAYKLVNSNSEGPYQGGIEYKIGESYSVDDASTDESVQCGAGINLVSLDWCLREIHDGYRILIAEFEAADIAAIPVGSDGKFRVHRCEIVWEWKEKGGGDE
jgi:hypothetical protein